MKSVGHCLPVREFEQFGCVSPMTQRRLDSVSVNVIRPAVVLVRSARTVARSTTSRFARLLVARLLAAGGWLLVGRESHVGIKL